MATAGDLLLLIENRTRGPSDTMIDLLKDSCDASSGHPSPLPLIAQFVRESCDAFLEHRTQEDGALAKSQEDVAVKLYYKILEAVVLDEKRRLSSEQFAAVLSQEAFHRAMLAAAFEVVLFTTHKNQYKFPWILETLSVAPLDFLKVIEPIVRVEPEFTRDIVSHFSRLEERILESMAWERASPLWNKLFPQNGDAVPVPSCEEAFLPCQLEAVYDQTSPAGRLQVKNSSVVDRVSGTMQMLLPYTTNPTDFPWPVDECSSDCSFLVLTEGNDDNSASRRKNGSIGIFFRKFYHLAFVRLKSFGELLEVKREDFIKQTWTCFEHSIRNFTEQLMRGRHLDQILMCCIYITSKATGEELKFEDIRKCYRTQRNAASHIYRSVLINNSNFDKPLTPVQAGKQQRTECLEDRGDIIKFYNHVFVETMGSFAEKLSGSVPSEAKSSEKSLLMLSPVPKIHETSVSPRKRVSQRLNVFVSPLKPGTLPPQSPKKFGFQLNLSSRFPPVGADLWTSPSGEQMKPPIPPMKNCARLAQKRLLTDLETENDSSTATGVQGAGKFARKLQSMKLPPFPK